VNSLGMFVVVLVAGYLGIVGFMYFGQDRLIYFPDIPERAVRSDPADIGLAFEDLTLTTGDGERIHAWYIPADPSRGAVIFFHGNAGNIGHRLDTVRILNALGVDCLMIDYRGYGRSTGRPEESGTYLDAQAAWEHMTQVRGFARSEIVLFGRSLGSAVAAWLAAENEPAGLILESSFTSVPDLGAELYPWLPVRLLSRYGYDTRAQLRRVKVPVLVAHSPADDVIPYRHGRNLFAAAPQSSTFLEMSGSHGDGFMRTGERYLEAFDDYLTLVLQPNTID